MTVTNIYQCEATSSVTIQSNCPSVQAFSALDFDGSNDCVKLDSAVFFDGSGFTIEGWVLPHQVEEWAPLLDFGNGEGVDNVVISLSQGSSGKPEFAIYNSTGQVTKITSSDTLELGRWAHLACVFDPNATGGPKGYMYLNGNLVAEGDMQAPGNVIRGNNCIGKSNWSSYKPINARIDELRIWNTPHSVEQIRDSSCMEVSPSDPTLDHYWQMTQDSGSVFVDLKGTAHGQLDSFALAGSSSNWVESYAMVVPKSPSISDIGGTTFKACWKAPATGVVDKYIIDISTEKDFSTLTQSDLESDSTCYVFNGLSSGQTYWWRVRAEKSSVTGEGAYLIAPDSVITCLNPQDSGQIGPDQVICWGVVPDSINNIAPATGSAGGTQQYQWQSSSDSTFSSPTIIPNSDTAVLHFTDSLFVTTWYRRLSRVDCKPDWSEAAISNVVKIQVDPLPVTQASVTLPACEGSTLQLNEIGGDANMWTWSGPESYSNATQSPTLVSAVPGIYAVTATNSFGCSDFDSVTVYPLPTMNATNNGPHCDGNIVRLFETGGDCSAWEWYLPGGFVSCVQNPVVSPVENGDHIVIGTTIHGCKSRDTTTVQVADPTANCADLLELCLDNAGAATLLATDVDNGSTGSPDFALTDMTLSGQTAFTCEDAGSAPFPVTLVVTDELGCQDDCTTMVTVGDTTSPTPDCAAANEVLLLWSGTEVTPASMISNAEDNCSGPVQLSFSPDFSTPSLMLSCREGLQDPLELTIYIQDGSGNVTTCVIPQVFVPAAEAENCLCDQEELHLQGEITSDDYKAKVMIMADGTIMPDDTVMLKAEQSITLSPGFAAAHGSYFAAKIDSCGLEPGSDLSAEEEGTDARSEEEQSPTTPSDIQLRVYPNPFQGQFTLELDLEQPAPVSVELYSLTGGRVSTLLSGEQLPAGTQRLTIDGSRLPAGIYMLSVTANGERTTRRVVRMQ